MLGCGELPRLNEDIVESTTCTTLTLPARLQHLEVKLKGGLAEHKDYEFVGAEGWAVLERYDNIEVVRFVVDTPDGQKV